MPARAVCSPVPVTSTALAHYLHAGDRVGLLYSPADGAPGEPAMVADRLRVLSVVTESDYGTDAASTDAEKKVGLARALSKMGFCSRSDAVEKIRAGLVRVNGAVRRDIETPVRVGRDKIEVDGRGVAAKEFVYWVVNKPRGIVTTAEDESYGEPLSDTRTNRLNVGFVSKSTAAGLATVIRPVAALMVNAPPVFPPTMA